jgi:outer membrane receptor protein involved in Fe transport
VSAAAFQRPTFVFLFGLKELLMRSQLKALLCGLMLCVSISAPALAQTSSTGTLMGKVLDDAGKPLSSARIGISGPTSTQTTTHPDGTYNVALPPGLYSVTISAPGFRATQQDGITVLSGESVTLATTLLPASLTTIASVSVGGATSVADSPAALTQLTAATMRSQGQDQITNVLDQIPGVEVQRAGGGSNEPGANTSISVRGAQPYESQVLIDGHPVDTIGNGAFGFNPTFTNAILLSGIEVSKGPGNMPNTVVDAVGGTVNLKTAPITPLLSTDFMTQYDSFGGWTYGVRVSDTIGKFGFLAAVARETTPGFMAPQNIFGFGRASFYSPYTSPTYPLTGNNQVYPTGTSYTGVLNYAYAATSDFSNDAQLFKLAYNFSPVTSLELSSNSTQTWLDETGNNVGFVNAKIVPCITNGLAEGSAPAGPTCAPGTNTYDENYTATPYLKYVGQTVPINLYAGYPNTYEIDREPIFTATFRTVFGSGTFLARAYGGSITRDIIQNPAPTAIGPCYSPACPWVGSSPALSTDAGNNYADDNGYAGEPYYELTTDTLHGVDAQYSLPLGDRGNLTIGFDSHSDSFNYTEAYSSGWYWYGSGTMADPYGGCGYPGQTAAQIYSCAYTIAFYPQPHITVRSTTENLRGTYEIARNLQFAFGGYLSNTTYVGSRFDPRGGLTWRPNSNLSVRASAGSAFVTPYQGLINNSTYLGSHETLYPATQFIPETSFGYDVGADYKYSRDSIISADLYSTTIFNRYALYQCVTAACTGMFNGKPYTSEVIPTSQGQTANRGVELTLLHQPKFGFGYQAAVDMLRDYSYNQVPVTSGGSLFLGPLPANGVQIPGYPYNKVRANISYTLQDGKSIRFGSTTYGANNAYGQPGFTMFDGSINLPVKRINFSIGATNLFNKDNGMAGGLYFGGYTYPGLGASGVGPTNFEYAQPRTVYVQVSTAAH